MNGYYQCEDPPAITRVKQQNFAYPCRNRPTLRQDSPAKAPASTVWNVVSGLVQALSDARDELLTLLTGDGVRVARKSDATVARHSSRSPSCRPLSAPSDIQSKSRSPIRTAGDRGPWIRSSAGPQKPHATMKTANYSPPVSFGMNLQFDSMRTGRSPPAGCRRPAGRYQSMNLTQRGITPHGLEYISAVPSGYGRRHCSATRFVDLIEAETYQLRERRLAEESASTLRNRPSWY